MKRVRIGIFVFDCVDEIDVVGPWEVLTAWRMITAPPSNPACGKEAAAGSPVDVSTFALERDGSPIRCAKGLHIVPDHVWGSPEMPDLDVLIYTGGPDMKPQIDPQDPRYDPAYGEMVAELQAAGTLMVSVCVGALAFARFGLLRGRRATTHWMAAKALAAIDPTIEFVPRRFVDDGDVITAAGISASIDLAFQLVERLDSAARAREVRRFLEYDPAPPASLLGNPGNPGWAVGERAQSEAIAHPAHGLRP